MSTQDLKQFFFHQQKYHNGANEWNERLRRAVLYGDAKESLTKIWALVYLHSVYLAFGGGIVESCSAIR